MISHRSQRLFPLFVIALLFACPIVAESFGVALLSDGPSRLSEELQEVFREELLALTEGEMELRFSALEGDWNRAGILAAAERAYADPEVDILLVTGLLANQILGTLETFPKVTFLPYVFDARLLGLPRAGRGSGKSNLGYLSDELDFAVNVESFREVVPFQRLGLLVDSMIFEAAAAITAEAAKIALALGVEVVPIPYSDPEGDLVALIPEGVEAVMIGGLPRLGEAAISRLIEGLIDRKMPSYSFLGDGMVRAGMLTTDTPDSDQQRLARRTALNLQAVMLGERVEDQPVDFVSKRRLFINMKTARAIDVWPRFDVLIEAELIDDGLDAGARRWSLSEVANEAVRTNLDLLAERLGVDAGAEDIREARAALLPQLSADLTVSQLDGASGAVTSGAAAQRSTSTGLSVRQLLWSEPTRANVEIQHHLQRSREAELEELRLDTVQLATVAFLDILRAETQFRVRKDNLALTRANLELAEDRVRIGSANAADIYRWQSELATSRQNAIDAHAARMRTRENLARVLHRPFTESFSLEPAGLDDEGLLFAQGDLGQLIDNPKAFLRLTELMLHTGLERAPSLASLRAAIAATERELTSTRRAFWVPEVALQGQASTVLEENRKAGFSLEGEDDWSLSVAATLPLFDGRARRARRARAEIELEQLRLRYTSAAELIEQSIRSSLHLANASYNSIALARTGAEAAAKNLELVSDAYSQGAVSILELLDAQSAALQAKEAASNSVYDFLVDLMNAQRASGRFDFFLDPAQRHEALEELRMAIDRGVADGKDLDHDP